MRVDQQLGDRQPQARCRPLRASAPCPRDRTDRRCAAGARRRCPAPLSATSSTAALPVPSDAHLDVSAGGCVFDRVVEQDQQHLLDALGVHLDQCRAPRCEPSSTCRASASGRVRRTTSEATRDRSTSAVISSNSPRSDRASCEQVLRQPLHARISACTSSNSSPCSVERLVAVPIEHVGRRAQDRQRRAQLVRGVGHEFLLARNAC